ncbi:MAG: Crp/Fnr family transcriptional regulator [Anaerolineaceae bacterium]|nr:Crp/Fnr family transcriptional regulator [Anaerolineaceae bacterium]
MVSPELLRRYPFFAFMSHNQLREVAMLTEEMAIDVNTILFHMGYAANALFLLQSGGIELHYVVMDENLPQLRKDFMIGTINPGEIVGISALIEPYKLTATAVSVEPCRLLKIDALALRDLCDQDHDLAYGLQTQLARTTMARLHATRVLLAAATVPV